MDEDANNALYSGDLAFLSRTAAELFDMSLEQNIYEVIGTRLKEMVGSAFVIINEYDHHTRLFHTKTLKGLGEFAGIVVKLLTRNPEDMAVALNDPEAMKVLLTGKMARGPAGLYELSFKTIPRIVCQTIEKLLNIGTIYVMGFTRQGELLGDAVIICRRGENETRIAQQTLFIETFINQAALALHRKQAEEALRKSEALFKLITENTSALVSIHDSNGDYLFASPSHEQLGFRPEELIGKSGFAMMEEEDIGPLLEHLEDAQKKEISKAFLNYRLRDKTGGIHYFRGSFDAVTKPDGSLERIVCVGEDITELRKAQAEKVEALALAAETEKLALVGQIAGKMAHDFNNILGVVMGNAELSLMDCPHENTRKTLELIFEQTLRGKNLTKNLVAFARDQEPRQEFFRIDEKMELVMTLLKKDLEGIRVIREYGRGIPELLADPGMVEHTVVNLVQNSIHAVSLVEHPEIIIRTYYQEECVVLEIEDNGCGIPSGFLKEIFEPSFTLKGSKDTAGVYKTGIKGTGYGMSNVKKYIDQHKGRISVHSELKKGTRVVVSLPVIKKELTDEEIQEVKKENICSGKYILLVEDEQAISDVQGRILTHEPLRHRVDIAASGQAAIDLVNRNAYDFISLDYILQGDFTGMDVYHHIRAKNQTVPVLFISGNIEFLESIKELKQRDPYIDHLSKPCKNMDYIGSIHKLLAGSIKTAFPLFHPLLSFFLT
jgi:PAS domain S-box-containing protein